MRRPFSAADGAWRAIAIGATFAPLVCGSPAHASEGEWRWRFYDASDRPILSITDTDGGTDALGSYYYECTRRSGWIDVVSVLDDKQRSAIADVIRGGKFPAVTLGGDDYTSALSEVRHSENDGWQVIFPIPAESRAFNQLRDNGLMNFEIGGVNFRVSFNVGLDQVGKFQNVCRKTPG